MTHLDGVTAWMQHTGRTYAMYYVGDRRRAAAEEGGPKVRASHTAEARCDRLAA